MSNMIKSGFYNINNVQYSGRYIVMSGNHEFVGHDVPDTVRVHHCSDTGLYLTLDPKVGLFDVDRCEIADSMKSTEPQILQLSSEDGEMFVIHPQDVNEVAYLKDDGNWSWIYVGPAPASGHAKYWRFCKAN
ncbi:hypothetical protein BDR07DRAFT_1439239 [Suillus spraguei]|nr:hypothetical protein BDR07DRAFT_1439239 [Suillus spraguei]